jgi:hypothetical protein
MNYKYAFGIAQGNSSSGRETEGKDKIKSVHENGVAVFSLADHGRMAEAAATLMTERFDEQYASGDDFIKTAILEKIEDLSGRDNTLLFVSVKENHYLAGHIGGGLIAGLNGSCSVLSKPESKEDITSLRIYKGELKEPFGFMLLSEGACQSLYEDSTGNLSPACGTFFEWLMDYDEETVSEALADNIDKYFLKDTKGEISVAIMVSDPEDAASDAEVPITVETEDHPETEAYQLGIEEKQPETELDGEPVRESGKYGKIVKYLIAIIVVAAAIFICTLIPRDGAEPKDAGKEEPKPPVTNSASYEPSVTFSVENPEAFEAGEYKAGVDIPAGEYFFWTGEMLEPGSIIVNDDTCLSDALYCMTIQLNEWDTLVSDHRFTAAENVNPVKAKDGILLSGKYKIGKDIAPGTYTVSPVSEDTKGRYYSIFDEEISNNTEVNGDTAVVVPEEGYVVFYKSVLYVE